MSYLFTTSKSHSLLILMLGNRFPQTELRGKVCSANKATQAISSVCRMNRILIPTVNPLFKSMP